MGHGSINTSDPVQTPHLTLRQTQIVEENSNGVASHVTNSHSHQHLAQTKPKALLLRGFNAGCGLTGRALTESDPKTYLYRLFYLLLPLSLQLVGNVGLG